MNWIDSKIKELSTIDIGELVMRMAQAIEQLNSLANEQAHRLHGCNYSEIDIDDLQGVIDILEGR